MKFNAPDHFSHHFELKLNTLPTKESDRTALSILCPGLFFGAILFFLGLYDLCNGFSNSSAMVDNVSPDNTVVIEPLISPWVFDCVIVIIGLGIIYSLVLSYIRYKKIFFDGKSVTVVHRPAFGKKKSFKDKLENYEGVRFRIEFFQFGIMNRNKYIIELYHKTHNKVVPLFISTSDKHIRRIWEYYARSLNLPALLMTDEGIVKRKVEDLDKSLQELAQTGLVKDHFDPQAPLPSSLALVRKSDKTVIKTRKILWDAYNIIAWIALFILGNILFISIVSDKFSLDFQNNPICSVGYLCGVVGILIAVWALFRKDKIVIKPHKIIIVHKFMLFSRKDNELVKADIKSVDVAFRPATERYFVTLSSDKKTMIFGKKLPIEDLRWVKAFLIHNIVIK